MASMPATLANGELHCFALKPLLLLLELAEAANGAVHANECLAQKKPRTFKRLRLVTFITRARLTTRRAWPPTKPNASSGVTTLTEGTTR